MRIARGLLAGAAAALLAAGPAAAATDVPGVAAAVATERLFIDPEVSDALSAEEADQLRERLADVQTPVYLAVLPGPASGPTPAPEASGLAASIAAAAGRPGTYAVVAGTSFHAASTVLGDRAEDLAADALDRGDDTSTALLEFVDAVELAAAQVGGAPAGKVDDGGRHRFGAPDPWIVAFAAVGGLVAFGIRRRR